ncbi:MAG: DUF190 domain-containing protein [Thermodesulfobacteriota bacterium]
MELPRDAERLSVYIGESDERDGRPLYEVLVEEARRQGLAGATALRGRCGFGANSRVHTSRILRLSEDLPVVVEIIDEPAKVDAFAAWLDGVIKEGLVVREKVRVVFYRHNGGS